MKVYYPEYEECRRIAVKKNIPISRVYNFIYGINKG
ncbi:hypothetical protein DRQ09_09180 [candidate division KSB1 bacterium]|nr:MAG: hypothetical protein DRQ09_09180 [candidate division KSB1 bacterium]